MDSLRVFVIYYSYLCQSDVVLGQIDKSSANERVDRIQVVAQVVPALGEEAGDLLVGPLLVEGARILQSFQHAYVDVFVTDDDMLGIVGRWHQTILQAYDTLKHTRNQKLKNVQHSESESIMKSW